MRLGCRGSICSALTRPPKDGIEGRIVVSVDDRWIPGHHHIPTILPPSATPIFCSKACGLSAHCQAYEVWRGDDVWEYLAFLLKLDKNPDERVLPLFVKRNWRGIPFDWDAHLRFLEMKGYDTKPIQKALKRLTQIAGFKLSEIPYWVAEAVAKENGGLH